MAQTARGRGDASGQAEFIKEIAQAQRNSSSKLLGQVTHDQLCDVINENLVNSDLEAKTGENIDTMSLQEKGTTQSSSTSARV